MKYLFVSDSHGDEAILQDIVQTWQDKVTAMYHCGDSELAEDHRIWQVMKTVRGNCDWTAFPERLVDVQGDDRIMCVHGHLENVKIDLLALTMHAKEEGANIVAYGHSHVHRVECVNGMLIINPGSIAQPRCFPPLYTYAIVDSDDGRYQVTYYDRTHQCISQLTQTFIK